MAAASRFSRPCVNCLSVSQTPLVETPVVQGCLQSITALRALFSGNPNSTDSLMSSAAMAAFRIEVGRQLITALRFELFRQSKRCLTVNFACGLPGVFVWISSFNLAARGYFMTSAAGAAFRIKFDRRSIIA